MPALASVDFISNFYPQATLNLTGSVFRVLLMLRLSTPRVERLLVRGTSRGAGASRPMGGVFIAVLAR